MASVFEVGKCLYLIKSHKLFRSTHHSFEAYCEELWDISRVHANRKIEAHQTEQLLRACLKIRFGVPLLGGTARKPPKGGTPNLPQRVSTIFFKQALKSEPKGSVSIPTKETHSRVMAGMTPAQKVETARKAKTKVGDREPTAKDWNDAAHEVRPTKATAQPNKAATESNPTSSLKEETPANVLPAPTAPPVTGRVWVQLPSDYHKGVNDLPSLKELSEKAKTLEYIKSDASKKKEREQLGWELKTWLPLWAEWEQHCLISAATKLKDAA